MRKGFSLIEILVVISIIFIFTGISLVGISQYNRLKTDRDLKITESSILQIINYGKQYCREKGKPGFVLFDVTNSEVDFYCQNKQVDSFKFPSDIKLYSINFDKSQVEIDKFGITGDAGTIVLRDNNNKIFSITVNVGVGYAEIK